MTKNKLEKSLSDKSVLFATFSPWEKGIRLPTNGMIEPMVSFFVPKVKRFILVDQPHPGSDVLIPIIEIYEKGRLEKKTKSSFLVSWLYPFLAINNSVGTRIPFKIRDFISCFDFVLKDKKKYDLFIGLESINALAGIVLKKLGFVKKTVYYVSDYSPNRYKSKWFNDIYLILDRLAATYSDYIWDVSLAMMPARIKTGLDKSMAAKVVHIPNALFPNQISYLPQAKVVPYSMVYAGTLGKENGPDLAIETLKIISKEIPKAKLHVFGGGDSDLKRLKKLTSKLELNDEVVFHGFFTDQIKLSAEIKKYALGLAPYKAIHGSPRWWADATKIRLYLAAGLPVITTQVPPLGKEIQKDNSGIVAKDNPKAQVKAIIKLFKNKPLYSEMRGNSIRRAKNNTWENTYSKAIEEMDIKL